MRLGLSAQSSAKSKGAQEDEERKESPGADNGANLPGKMCWIVVGLDEQRWIVLLPLILNRGQEAIGQSYSCRQPKQSMKQMEAMHDV